MPQLNFYVTLIGGPPWGFRIKQQDGDLPIVTQVRPNSRACNGGVRVGDVIESVNGKLCVLASEIYKKMSLLQGVIKLKLNRRNVYEQKPLFLFYLSSDTDSESTPELAKPTIFLSDVCINPAAKPPFKKLSSDMRDILNKKKVLSLATAHKNSVFSLINDHESHSPSKNTSHSTISESSTDISGYDTVAGDYYDQCTPIKFVFRNVPSQNVVFSFQDSWSCQKKILQTDGAKPFLTFNGNESTIEQALRAESTTQLAIRLNVDRQPSLPCVDQSNNGNSSSVDKSDGNEYSYLFIDQNMHDKFIDSNAALLDAVNPSTVGAMDLEKSKKWSIRVDQKNEDKPATIITSSVKTGKASGQVEVPPPQSVAELRAQIAAKLIVRNPTENKNSSLPSKDTLFFKKHQPAKLCDQKLISTSTLSLDRAPQSSESSDLHGCFSTKESQFTREVSPTPSLSSLKDCDKLRKCNQSRTKFYEEKRCFTPTLKRQHSQLQLRPEVQHAVVLIPKNGKQGPLMRASVSMLNLSTQSEHSPPPLSFHSPTVPKNENHVLSGSSMYPSTLSNNYCFDNTANNEQEITDVSFNENVNVCDNVFECQSERLNCDQRDAPFEELSVDQEYLLNRSHNFSKVDISKPICQNESHADKPNSHVSESFVDTANAENSLQKATFSVNQKKEQFENVPKLNRLTELIDLAKKSFGDKSDNSELIDKLWFKTLEDKNRPNLPTGMLYRPQSVMELSSNSNMTKHCTLPAQNHRQKSQSQWYRQITRQIHHPSLKNSEQDMPGDVVLEQDVSNLKLNTSQPSVDHQLTNISPQRLRAKSVGRYDAVADMEILDKFMQQRQQHNLNANDNNRDKINFIKGEAQQIASTSYMETTQNRQNYLSSKNNSNNAARAANSYAMSRSKTQHFHLPSYRFVHEDARPFVSPRSCYCCDNATLKKETERESLGEKIKLRYIENRLQDTAQGLQKIVKQLESYGKTRSKSNPEIAYKLRNCRDKFNYFVGQKQSDVNKHVKTTDDVKKNLLEEVIQRQKAEKLSEELNDQRSRQHSYYPGAAPVLQNNVQRFNHLMYSSQTNDVEGNSNQSFTPNRRSTNVGSIQTCTVLYKFVAQTPRELNLNRGDVVRVHREVDNNWIEGERNGRVGIFPASYVQIDEESSASNNRVQALHPFQARNRNELSLRKNEVLTIRREIDVNWIEGTNSKGQIGIFPRCYICDYNEANDNNLISSHIPDRPKTPKIVTTSNSYRTESPLPSKKEANHIEQVQQWEQRRDNFGYSGPARLVPKNSETYRVLYSYKPEYSDELELQENDIVFVVEKCDDGWFIGTLLRNGQLGTFPGNYVEKH